MISLGIEQLIKKTPHSLQRRRFGLFCNQASTDQNFNHSRDLVNRAFPGQLTCLFSPQHGFFSEKQDNMIESDHSRDPVSGLPVFSLYGEYRKPTREMFEQIDVLLIDLIDVGTRVYTFIWSVVYCLQTAAATGKQVIILDRPNPLGGRVEGNLLQEEWSSFVGLHTVPMRHGLTIGEMALLCNQEMGIDAELQVIAVAGWQRDMLFDETGLPWLYPSPNMPSPATALVYPGQVIWEGSNISEGRGTTLPFELCGAPFIRHQEVMTEVSRHKLPGCLLRPLVFEPTSGKWAGQACCGFQIHVISPDLFKPYYTSLCLYQTLFRLYPEQFAYKEPPYEYEYERLPMDLILGSRELRRDVEQGCPLEELEESWQDDLNVYKERCRVVLLYE
jgi:uncharacterized protein YbbC (DUF1343 family)